MTKKIATLVLVPFFLAACQLTIKTKPTPNGGVFKSVDGGQNWVSKSAVPTVTGQPQLLNVYNVNFLQMDPTDNRTIYASFREKGLYVTYNSAESWLPLMVGQGEIIDLVIDPEAVCTLYAATVKNVLKSNDCGRRWRTVFLEKRRESVIRDLAIDNNNPSVLYIGLSTAEKGEVFYSDDYGNSWQVLKSDLKNWAGVRRIYVNPKNTDIIYLALNNGFWRTADRGKTWENLSPYFKEAELKGGNLVVDLEFLPEEDDAFIIASKYGLIKAEDGGKKLQAYVLLQQPGKGNLLDLSISPKNTDIIYYTTFNGIYKTVDGGDSWITLKVPSSRRMKALLVDPNDPNVLYLGVWNPPK